MKRTIDDANGVIQRFVATYFPEALAVLLAGSWVKGDAHADSDLDIIIVDKSINKAIFEGVHYEDWIIDVCALNPHYAEEFFNNSAKYKSAPIPHQVANSILVSGECSLFEQIQQLANDALVQGPEPISDYDRIEISYDITLLRSDLKHSTKISLPALAAYAHVQLSKAVLDARTCWRAERKALRQAVEKLNADLADDLDEALAEAVQGNPNLMIQACDRVIEMLGGARRTYARMFV